MIKNVYHVVPNTNRSLTEGILTNRATFGEDSFLESHYKGEYSFGQKLRAVAHQAALNRWIYRRAGLSGLEIGSRESQERGLYDSLSTWATRAYAAFQARDKENIPSHDMTDFEQEQILRDIPTQDYGLFVNARTYREALAIRNVYFSEKANEEIFNEMSKQSFVSNLGYGLTGGLLSPDIGIFFVPMAGAITKVGQLASTALKFNRAVKLMTRLNAARKLPILDKAALFGFRAASQAGVTAGDVIASSMLTATDVGIKMVILDRISKNSLREAALSNYDPYESFLNGVMLHYGFAGLQFGFKKGLYTLTKGRDADVGDLPDAPEQTTAQPTPDQTTAQPTPTPDTTAPTEPQATPEVVVPPIVQSQPLPTPPAKPSTPSKPTPKDVSPIVEASEQAKVEPIVQPTIDAIGANEIIKRTRKPRKKVTKPTADEVIEANNSEIRVSTESIIEAEKVVDTPSKELALTEELPKPTEEQPALEVVINKRKRSERLVKDLPPVEPAKGGELLDRESDAGNSLHLNDPPDFGVRAPRDYRLIDDMVLLIRELGRKHPLFNDLSEGLMRALRIFVQIENVRDPIKYWGQLAADTATSDPMYRVYNNLTARAEKSGGRKNITVSEKYDVSLISDVYDVALSDPLFEALLKGLDFGHNLRIILADKLAYQRILYRLKNDPTYLKKFGDLPDVKDLLDVIDQHPSHIADRIKALKRENPALYHQLKESVSDDRLALEAPDIYSLITGAGDTHIGSSAHNLLVALYTQIERIKKGLETYYKSSEIQGFLDSLRMESDVLQDMLVPDDESIAIRNERVAQAAIDGDSQQPYVLPNPTDPKSITVQLPDGIINVPIEKTAYIRDIHKNYIPIGEGRRISKKTSLIHKSKITNSKAYFVEKLAGEPLFVKIRGYYYPANRGALEIAIAIGKGMDVDIFLGSSGKRNYAHIRHVSEAQVNMLARTTEGLPATPIQQRPVPTEDYSRYNSFIQSDLKRVKPRLWLEHAMLLPQATNKLANVTSGFMELATKGERPASKGILASLRKGFKTVDDAMKSGVTLEEVKTSPEGLAVARILIAAEEHTDKPIIEGFLDTMIRHENEGKRGRSVQALANEYLDTYFYKEC